MSGVADLLASLVGYQAVAAWALWPAMPRPPAPGRGVPPIHQERINELEREVEETAQELFDAQKARDKARDNENDAKKKRDDLAEELAELRINHTTLDLKYAALEAECIRLRRQSVRAEVEVKAVKGAARPEPDDDDESGGTAPGYRPPRR